MPKWTHDDVVRVDEMAARGMKTGHIAAVMGRSIPAINSMMHRHGISNDNKVRWSAEERATLLRMRAEKATMSEVADALCRSLQSVKFQCWRLRNTAKHPQESCPVHEKPRASPVVRR